MQNFLLIIFSVNTFATEFNFIEQNAEIGDANSLENATQLILIKQ